MIDEIIGDNKQTIKHNKMRKLANIFGYVLLIAMVALTSCGDDDGENPPVDTAESNVRIFKVNPDDDKIYLKNFGDLAQDVSTYWICNRRNYAEVNTLTSSADLILDPDEMIELDRALSGDFSDVALYLNNASFADASNLIDFMQYGQDVGNSGRVSVAVAKGIWTAGEFVDGFAPFEYEGDGEENGASFWAAGEGMANVRIFKVNGVEDKFYLKNFGNTSSDLSNYWVCNLKSYAQINTLTTDAADLTLDPNEVIGFERTLDDENSDFGFYRNNTDFGDAANMIDFMQYGADQGTNGRVDVAVTKGIWTAGEFVDGFSPFEYDGDGTQNGASNWTGGTGMSNVRIFKVNGSEDKFYLKNFGDVTADLTNYWICNTKSYEQMNNLTTDATDLMLDPDEVIGFDRVLDDASSDVGFYRNNTDFGDEANMIDFMQYGADIGANGRVDVAVRKGIWTTGEFVDGTAPLTYEGNGDENGASFWEGTAGMSNVRIFNVDPTNDQVTLKNLGDASQDISSYWFCRRKAYVEVNTLTTASPDLILDAGEEITFTLTINDNSSDVAFYLNNTDFGDAANMIDFLQFGDDIGDAGRANVAVTKGIWTAGDFINGVAPYSYSGDGTENGESVWSTTSTGTAIVRMLSVDPSTGNVILKNFGDASLDIENYWFCRRFAYDRLGTLTAASGNFILAPDEEISISVSMNTTSSDMGLYNTNTFGSSTAMEDFVQYGEGGIGREGVANTKGIWTTGDFVPNPGPFNYTGNGIDNGLNFWSGN